MRSVVIGIAIAIAIGIGIGIGIAIAPVAQTAWEQGGTAAIISRTKDCHSLTHFHPRGCSRASRDHEGLS